MSTDKIKIFLLKLLLIVIPLIYLPTVRNPYEQPKFIFFIFTILIIIVLDFATQKPVLKTASKDFGFNNLTDIILIYWLIILLADFFGLDPRISILGSEFRHQGFLTLTIMIVFYLMIKTNGPKKEKLLPFVLWSNLLVSFFAGFGAIQLYLLKKDILTYNGRIVGTLGNPNSLAGYLVITLPFLITVNLPNRRLSTIFKISFLLINTIIIFLSGSKGAMLALSVILIIYFIKLVIKKESLWVSMIAIIISLFLFFGIGKNLRLSIWDNRLIFWQEGIKAFSKRPILGYGQENFELIIPGKWQMRVDNSHNLFLEILISSGISGLSIFVLLLIKAFKKSAFYLKLFFISYLIRGFFNPLSIAEIMIFWFSLGLI